MDECKHAGENEIRKKSAHTFKGRFFVVGIGTFLRNEQVYQERADVCYKHTGRCMKTRVMAETIQGESQCKGNQHLQASLHAEGHPQNEQEIQVRSYHLVQVYLVQYKYLYQDE